MTINSEERDLFYTKKDVIVDSGTSFFLMPDSDLNTYLDALKEKTGISFEVDTVPQGTCTYDQVMSIPDIEFTIDQTKYLLPSSSFVFYE